MIKDKQTAIYSRAVHFTDDEKKRFQDFAKSQGQSLTAQLRVSIEKDIKNTESNK